MSKARVRSLRVVVFLAGATGVLAFAQRPAEPAQAPAAPGGPSIAFTRIFEQYRQGDIGPAIRAFSRWPEARVAAEALRPSDETDVATLEALAMFHTDTGISTGRFGLFSESAPRIMTLGGYGLEDVFEIHSLTAYKIVDALAKRGRETKNVALLEFAETWHIVAMSACATVPTPKSEITSPTPSLKADPAAGVPARTPPAPRPDAPPDDSGFKTASNGKGACGLALADKARHDFPDDAEIWLRIGAQEEPPMMTRSQVEDMRQPFNVNFGEDAIQDFNHALKLDPKMSEARMRKAHVLYVGRNEPDAKPMFEQALADARATRNTFVWHLSALFLGEFIESNGDLAAAVPYYREAHSVLRTHTASIALGQALIRTGHVAEGWAIGSRMFGREGSGAEPVEDPWTSYRRVGAWQIEDRLTRLREIARGQ